jgi:hypothetical protein
MTKNRSLYTRRRAEAALDASTPLYRKIAKQWLDVVRDGQEDVIAESKKALSGGYSFFDAVGLASSWTVKAYAATIEGWSSAFGSSPRGNRTIELIVDGAQGFDPIYFTTDVDSTPTCSVLTGSKGTIPKTDIVMEKVPGAESSDESQVWFIKVIKGTPLKGVYIGSISVNGETLVGVRVIVTADPPAEVRARMAAKAAEQHATEAHDAQEEATKSRAAGDLQGAAMAAANAALAAANAAQAHAEALAAAAAHAQAEADELAAKAAAADAKAPADPEAAAKRIKASINDAVVGAAKQRKNAVASSMRAATALQDAKDATAQEAAKNDGGGER